MDAGVGHHLRLDGNLHKAGGPAALKAAATVAGVIVRGDVQHVLARLAERDVRRCLPAERRGTASRRRQLLDLRLRLSNATVPGPRYFDHVTVTGGRGFAIGALVLLVYFMSSVAQMVSGSGADNEAVRLAACATVAIGPWIVDPF